MHDMLYCTVRLKQKYRHEIIKKKKYKFPHLILLFSIPYCWWGCCPGQDAVTEAILFPFSNIYNT